MGRKQVGFDFGFRFTKIMTYCKNIDFLSDHLRMIPTAVGGLSSHIMAVPVGHRFEEAGGVDGSFSVGKYAVKYGGIPTNRQDRGWFQTPEFLKMFYGACVEAGVVNGDVLDVVLCIPIDDKKYASEIKALLMGTHSFRLVGGLPVEFYVSSVKVTLQGVASFFHLAFNLEGNWREDVDDWKIYGLDAGGNTLHEVKFDALTDIQESTLSHFNCGYWRVINHMGEYLTKQYEVSLPIIQVADIVERGKIFLDGEIDLTPVITGFEEDLARDHTNLISSRDLRDRTHLFVSGGTGQKFLSYYQKINPRFELLPFYQYANVIGAMKFAATMGRG